jgi:hypothetical protein
MLRFLPDSWGEFLLRPLLLADPAAGLYAEIQAPDLRFAVLAIVVALGLAHRRSRALLAPYQWRLLLGLTACIYFWTWVAGNGRYFMWGLLVVGPMVVLAIRQLQFTQSMRNTLILGTLSLQGFLVLQTYNLNVWGLRTWNQGLGMDLEPHQLRQEPAAFVTIGSISYSILVPYMHPQSRWANMAGQQDLVPGMLEHARLQALLDGPLPVKVMLNVTDRLLTPDGQPHPHILAVIDQFIQRQGLARASGPCELLRTRRLGPRVDPSFHNGRAQDFLFCPVRRDGGARTLAPAAAVASELDDVFERVEQRCPRFFPPGNAHTGAREGAFVRRYSTSDTTLMVDETGTVYFKYFRGINHTRVGSLDEVRSGRFTLDCTRIPGRYLPPWKRD